jgi:NAD dependent epimerase/dehydratase family enzyme
MKKKNIDIITGASGMIGSTLVNKLINDDNLLILGSASSSPVDTGSHTLSKLYLRVSRYSNGAYQTVDYDVTKGGTKNNGTGSRQFVIHESL